MGKKRVGNFRSNFLGGFNRQDVINYIEQLHKRIDNLKEENELLLQKLPDENVNHKISIEDKLIKSTSSDSESDVTAAESVEATEKNESHSLSQTVEDVKSSLGIEAEGESEAYDISDDEISAEETGSVLKDSIESAHEDEETTISHIEPQDGAAAGVKVAVITQSHPTSAPKKPKSISIKRRRKK